MKAGVLFGKGDIRYSDWADPVTEPGQIKIKVKACGICGSDVPRVHGDEAHFFPIILGHEFSGEVCEVGEGVDQFQLGDRVTAAPLRPCMKCEACLTGSYSQCPHYSFIGSREPGGFAEYVTIPATGGVKFSPAVSYQAGAMFEPSTVALHGVFCADYRPGARVAILGGGNIGMFALQWVKILGARSATVFDIAEDRLALAKELGADEVINTIAPDFEEKKKALIRAGGYDYVFETAGQPATIKLGLELTATHRTLCCIGTPHRDFDFPWKLWEQMNRKECKITGSWMSYSAPFPGKEWEMTAHYLSTGALKIDSSMIFAEIPLPEIARAFDLFVGGKTVGGKVLVVEPGL